MKGFKAMNREEKAQQYLEKLIAAGDGIRVLQKTLEIEETRYSLMRQEFSFFEEKPRELVEFEETVNGILAQKKKDFLSICGVIEAVHDDCIREYLQLRYIDGLTFREIAGIMMYSVSSLHRFDMKAMPIVADLLGLEGDDIRR